LRTYLDCYACFMRQALNAARVATSDEHLQHAVLNSVAEMLPQLPLSITPPEIAQQTYKLVYKITGDNDPFRESKRTANQRALEIYPRLKAAVASANDPLLAACKLAIAGNAIDLGPTASNTSHHLITESAILTPLAVNDYPTLKQCIKKSKRILYLGDNAGEIVFDRILIEELRQVKELDISFVVRESPIINDATLYDALSVGLDRVAAIISSGSDAPGIILSQCSQEMLDLYYSADVIISKGQGNYESLSDESINIFFLLKAKCLLVASQLGVSIGDAILIKNGENQRRQALFP